MAEPARPTLAEREFFDDLEVHLNDWNHHELRNALARLDLERTVAAIPAGDHDLPLVVGVDQSYNFV